MTAGKGLAEARIWQHARAMGKAMIKLAPEDFVLDWQGDAMKITATFRTTHEVEAVCEIIRRMTSSLDSMRPMIRGDIYPPEPAPDRRESPAQGIMVDPDIMGGQPCVYGQRMPTRAIRELAKAGYAVNQIIGEYPTLTPLEIANALAWEMMPAKMRKDLLP